MAFVEVLGRDLRLAIRKLGGSPGFTAVAVISLALGIGANTLMFSFMNAVLFKPLPYPDADRLVEIRMTPGRRPTTRMGLTPPMYFMLRDLSKSFDAVGVYDGGRSVSLAGDKNGEAAERLRGHRISATALAAFGVKPYLGRFHTLDEDMDPTSTTVLLGYSLWQRRFGGRRDVVGQTTLVDGRPSVIIGVMPPGFETFDGSNDVWLSMGFDASAARGSAGWLDAVGRLKKGVSIEQAVAESRVATNEYNATFPDRGNDWGVSLEPLHEALFGGMRTPLITLQAAVIFVLLISCANLAALLLTRAAARERELAVRAALGQSRLGLIRQLLVESLVLAFAGGVLGAFLAWLLLKPLLLVTPDWFPRLDEVGFDGRVFLFSTAVCILTGIVFGLVPAWQASRPNLAASLHEAGRGASVGRHRRLQLNALVMLQVAMAFALLIGAGLMIRTFVGLRTVDFGVDTSNLLSFQIQLPRGVYMTPNVGQAAGGSIGLVDYNPAATVLIDRIHEALQHLPGVESAAGSVALPFAGASFAQFRIEGAPSGHDGMNGALCQYVTEDYFKTMKMRLVQGRDFTGTDQFGSPWVLVVNQAMVDQYWKGQNPIGQRLDFTFYPGDAEPAREVVGVVADTRLFREATAPEPVVYALRRQQSVRQRASLESDRTQMAFIMRTAGNPMALAASVREATTRVDASIPVMQLRTVNSYLAAQTDEPRFIATLFACFAGIALVIGAIGIYGVTTHAVTQRYREFGIRRALGARTDSILGLVLRRALLVITIGVLVGLGASLMLARFVASFLWGVKPDDVVTFVVIAAVLLVTGFAASLVPALRATRVDPLVTLRYE
jgi:putative ABC transport system permease protein